ncbi:MAG TPA: Fic family protein [Gemmatimonadales bacterium]|nr:Fic family protein [Gemmatimonadales bacterium]
MRIPLSPPDDNVLLSKLFRDPVRAERLGASFIERLDATPGGRYRHWDTLRHLRPPGDLSIEEWWLGLKLARRTGARRVPLLRDARGHPFWLTLVDPILRMLHAVDQQASGAFRGSAEVVDDRQRETYLMKSLFEEAITSSQLEGAVTTREVAKEMLQRGREPRDKSERMILNNYSAMEFIRSVRAEPLTPAIVFELHRILSDDTMDEPTAAGRFRYSSEDIRVYDHQGQVLHVPPPAPELPARLDALCQLANAEADDTFLHPVVRAILLHFGLAYDHPFVDGNGRTARALFYWAMAHQGYWLSEYLSISRILRRAPSKYYRAFLYTETDGNDATYFVLHQLRVLERSISELHRYLERRASDLRAARRLLVSSTRLQQSLNHRQLALLNHALKNPGFTYTFISHQRSHRIAYQTSRTDLGTLANLGLLIEGKSGRSFHYQAPADLQARMAKVV